MALNESRSSWVQEQLSLLDASADWRPNAGAALTRLTGRAERRRRQVRRAWSAATAGIVVAMLAATPSVHIAAQRAWQVLFARDVSILRVDMDDLPAAVRDALQTPVTVGRIHHQSAASWEDASQMAGFRVERAPSALLPAAPRFSVVSPLSGELVLSVDALEKAARSTGATDLLVPPDWDGAHLRVETGPLVLTDYGATTLLQTPPITIRVPPDFDMPAFVAAVFRLLGLDPVQALALSQKAATAPVAFLGIPRGERVSVSEVPLGSGMGTMLRDLDEGELTLIWSTGDRLYVLTGPIAEELALAVANGLR